MIKRWISNFIRNNKEKFKDIGVKLIIVAIVVFIATIILSTNIHNTPKSNTIESSYKPTETVIKGSDVSEKQYNTDKDTINKFLDYCNNGDIEKAYDLISDECKANIYSNIQIFKQSYYNQVFNKKREYNLQSWISNNKYTVYKIRYTTNILASGSYDENDVYQDYITLIKDSEKEKISIGSYIYKEDMNITSKTNEIEANVICKNIYLDYEEYKIKVKNNTENIILLDTLQDNTLKLNATTGDVFSVYINNLFIQDLLINPGETKTVTIKFRKSCSSTRKSSYINFKNIIRNYEEYKKDEENYKDTFNANIRVN